MPEENPPPHNAHRWLHVLVAFVVAFDLIVLFQWLDGAFKSEFGGHFDEASHFLAGTHVRDRLRPAQDGGSPAIEGGLADLNEKGEGGSLFSVALGGWMAAFGVSRMSVMLFMALLAASTGTLIFCVVRREHGVIAAVVALAIWLSVPAARQSFSVHLPEQLYALLVVLVLWLAGAFACKPGQTDEVNQTVKRVGSFVSLASLMVILGVIGLATGVFLGAVHGDMRAASTFLGEVVFAPGIAVASFALVGILTGRPSNTFVRPAAAAMTAGILAVRWFKSNEPETWLLVTAMPALSMLAVSGAFSLAAVAGSSKAIACELQRRRLLWMLLLLLAALPANFLSRHPKQWSGFASIAQILADEPKPGARVLVVSDPVGENVLLSEIVMLGAGGKVSVERGSSVLALPPEPGTHGKPAQRFIEDSQLLAYIASGRIQYLVLDSSVPQEVRADYHDQTRRVVEDNISSFWPICESQMIRDGEPMGHPLRVFRVSAPGDAQRRLQ